MDMDELPGLAVSYKTACAPKSGHATSPQLNSCARFLKPRVQQCPKSRYVRTFLLIVRAGLTSRLGLLEEHYALVQLGEARKVKAVAVKLAPTASVVARLSDARCRTVATDVSFTPHQCSNQRQGSD
eukprot:2914407-Amphidinium_carterae.1